MLPRMCEPSWPRVCSKEKTSAKESVTSVSYHTHTHKHSPAPFPLYGAIKCLTNGCVSAKTSVPRKTSEGSICSPPCGETILKSFDTDINLLLVRRLLRSPCRDAGALDAVTRLAFTSRSRRSLITGLGLLGLELAAFRYGGSIPPAHNILSPGAGRLYCTI